VSKRFIIIGLYFVFIVMVFLFADEHKGVLLTGIFIGTLGDYFPVCDSLPPEEKARRRAKQEIEHFAVSSIGT
jgi:hypothetical protein